MEQLNERLNRIEQTLTLILDHKVEPEFFNHLSNDVESAEKLVKETCGL